MEEGISAPHGEDSPEILRRGQGDLERLDSSMRYWFWDVPLQNGGWLASKEFMVTDVIEEVVEQAPNSTYSLIYSSKKNMI